MFCDSLSWYDTMPEMVVLPNFSFVLIPNSCCVPVMRVLLSGKLTLPASRSWMISSSLPWYFRASLSWKLKVALVFLLMLKLILSPILAITLSWMSCSKTKSLWRLRRSVIEGSSRKLCLKPKVRSTEPWGRISTVLLPKMVSKALPPMNMGGMMELPLVVEREFCPRRSFQYS